MLTFAQVPFKHLSKVRALAKKTDPKIWADPKDKSRRIQFLRNTSLAAAAGTFEVNTRGDLIPAKSTPPTPPLSDEERNNLEAEQTPTVTTKENTNKKRNK